MTVDAAAQALAAIAPALAAADAEAVADWAPDEVPPTIRMGGLARAMVAAAGDLTLDEVRGIFAMVEDLMVDGPEDVRVAVATGFLEDLMSELAHGRVDMATIAEFLGPASRAHCEAWEQFIHDHVTHPDPR
jgi:hypothetical protein